MPFRPKVNQNITLQQTNYSFTEHPAAKGMPYGQTGRRATVYQVRDGKQSLFALKVFTLAFREQRNAESAEKLAAYARLPGMQACQRSVFIPQRHTSLLQQYPDLEYTVLMPWVVGETWQEIILNKRPLSQDQSKQIAEDFVRILARLEGEGVAHCDLSGPNVMVKFSGNGGEFVSLVDVEDLYAPGLNRPAKLPGGSAGYAHKTAPQGLWGADADRFGGAVLLAEMLGWCDERLRRIAHSEQYFDPGEMQQGCERYQVLLTVLGERWGSSFAEAFGRAWFSQTQADCPTLTEWAVLLGIAEKTITNGKQQVRLLRTSQEKQAQDAIDRAESYLERGEVEIALTEAERAHRLAPHLASGLYARALTTSGSRKERSGLLKEALADYQKASQIAPPGGLRDELTLIVEEVRVKIPKPVPAKKENGGVSLCPKCQKEIRPEWTTCLYCGEILKVVVPTAGQVSQPITPPQSHGWRWVLGGMVLFGLVVVLLGGGLIAAYSFQQQQAAEARQATNAFVREIEQTRKAGLRVVVQEVTRQVEYNDPNNSSFSTDPPPNTPIPPPTLTPEPRIYRPFPNDPSCASSRLQIGDRAYVAPEATRLGVRCYPDTHPDDNLLYKVYANKEVKIIGGPVCNYGWILWQIPCDGSIQWNKDAVCPDSTTCWITETDKGVDFYLVPIKP